MQFAHPTVAERGQEVERQVPTIHFPERIMHKAGGNDRRTNHRKLLVKPFDINFSLVNLFVYPQQISKYLINPFLTIYIEYFENFSIFYVHTK